ncbi:hypothetical protein VP758_005276, partial [Vibrio harveyi]|nr:hypothetical protein [Vibrio harveyi]
EFNQPPTIAPEKIELPARASYGTFDIDLSNTTGLTITDPESQDWQLVGVHSMNGLVSSTNPDSISNKTFRFNPHRPGKHDVTYVISDNQGGYATGQMSFYIPPPTETSNYNTVTANGKKFSKLLTYKEALDSGYISEPWWNNKTLFLPLFSPESAKARCASIGRLPTQEELTSLSGYNWDTGKEYIATNGNAYVSVNLTTDSVSNAVDGYNYFSTCVENRNLYIASQQNEMVANNTAQQVLVVGSPSSLSSATVSVQNGSLNSSQVQLEKST